MTRWVMLLAAVMITSSAGAATAQTIGIRGYLTYGATSFVATDTLDAIGAGTRHWGLGAGFSVTGLWRGLFADVAFTQQQLEGERVFVDNGTVYRLGIPLTIRMRPIDLAGGWRVVRGRISPYAGAGVSVVGYRERSDFALAGDNVSERASGALVLGGADVTLVRWLAIGGEIRYRAVSGVFGEEGVSQIYGEDQLGGVSASLRISLIP